MKKIFVTGASSGIGRAIAELLVREGNEVWGTSRDPSRLPLLEGFHPVALDLAESESACESFSRALVEAGHFDVVINNAGSGHFGPASAISEKIVREQFQVLVFAQIRICQLALAAMEARGSGMIINVSSMAARLPVPFMSAYNAAKAAFASYTMTLQLELRGSKVRVVDVQPADIRTSFNDAVVEKETDDPSAAQIWKQIDGNLQAAPPPELVARRISRVLGQTNPPPRLSVGGIFQARIAPLIFRFLPQPVRIWGLKKYYRI